jgi:hypothetical protein
VSNLILNEKKSLNWEPISGASEYLVSNGIRTIKTSGLSISLEDIIDIAGTYTVDVRSLSNLNTVIRSKSSNTISVTKLSSPVVTKANAGLITWSAVPGAEGYIVYNNSFISEPITGTQYNLLSGPESTVKVIAISSETNTLNSGFSNIINYNLG